MSEITTSTTCDMCGGRAVSVINSDGNNPGLKFQCLAASTHIKYPQNEHFIDIMDKARLDQLKKRPKKV